MVIKEIKGTLEERISSKSGKPYKVIVIKLTDNYEKTVFLDRAELELLSMQPPVHSSNSLNPSDF